MTVWNYGNNMMGWGWLIGAIIVVVIVVVLIVAVVIVVRLVSGRPSHHAPLPMAGSTPTPRQILDERYAKGDLTSEEYLERVKHLGSA